MEKKYLVKDEMTGCYLCKSNQYKETYCFSTLTNDYASFYKSTFESREDAENAISKNIGYSMMPCIIEVYIPEE